MASEEVSQNEEPYVTLLHREVRKGGEFLEKVRAQENEDYAKKAEVPVIDFIRHGDCKSYQNIVDFLLETQTPGAEETTRLIWLDDKAREKLNIDIFEFYSQIRYLAKKLKDKGVKRGSLLHGLPFLFPKKALFISNHFNIYLLFSQIFKYSNKVFIVTNFDDLFR